MVGEEAWLDPNHDEATAGGGTLVLACIPALNVVTNVWQNGSMSTKRGLEAGFSKSWLLFPNLFHGPTVHGGLPGAMCKNTFNCCSVSRLELRPRVDRF